MSDTMEDQVATNGQAKVLDHEYDGIREYDNPTPGWWSAIFVVSIIFAMFYFAYYHSQAPDRSIFDEYEAASAADFQREFAKMGELKPDTQSLLAYMHKADYMLVGKSIFKSNCVSCHAGDGSGIVGPNMTDDYYKNVQTLEDLPKVIASGAGNGAMPSWKVRGLHQNEIILVAAYVASLRGQNLPGPRGAEGKAIPPWPAYVEQPTPASAPAAKP
jgi:cytochrome c oxidase cbb3-type subunit III